MLLTLSLTLFELCWLPVIYSAITSCYLLLAREVFPDVPSSLVSTSDSCHNFVLRQIKQSRNDLHKKNKHKAHVLLRHSVAKSKQEPWG